MAGDRDKMGALVRAAQFDVSCACGTGVSIHPMAGAGKEETPIFPAALPGGGTIPVLKVLQSSGCERDCNYCVERSGGVRKGACFTPDELARLFDDLNRAGRVRGLFLSSAIRRGPVQTMDDMLATAEIIRKKQQFRGYVHLKIIPGAEEAQIHRAMALADRVSINLEAPTAGSLRQMAPGKHLDLELMRAMALVGNQLKRPHTRCRSQTTQFVVGASDETDAHILNTLWRCYRELNLQRGYFSAFKPIAGTPLAYRPPAPAQRQNRLYQSDFLLRQYGFTLEELSFDEDHNLPLGADPKTLWADSHPERFPLEINRASYEALLRVPGIGPGAAKAILRIRKETAIRSTDALRAVSPKWRTAAPYFLFDGRIRARKPYRQLDLFE